MKQNENKHMNVHQNCSVGNWEAIFKAVHDLIMILDIDNRIIDANPAVFKSTGLSEDQVLGQFCYKIFHCTEKPSCDCPYVKLKNSHHQESCTMEMEALGRKYLVTVAPVFEGESGQMTKIVHIAKDITDLKKAEAASLDSEKKFQGIFDAASDGILVADIVDKKFVDANRAICELLGYTRDELFQLNVNDIHPQKDLPEIIEVFEKQVRRETVLGLELPVKRKDGSIFYADISSRPLKLGERQFLIGIFRDATLRLQAEQLLKAEKNKVQKYLDVASVMLVALNTEGEVTLINQQGCNVLKVNEEFALGKNWFDYFIPKETAQEVRKIFKRIMSGDLQPVEYYENQVVTQNGELRIIAFHNTILTDEKGVIVGTLSSGEDITDRKQAEEDKIKLEQQIQKNKKLESIGTLAGGIAHDFNNILSAILGNINLALFDTTLLETTRNLLAESEKASLRAKDLVQQLLTFSRGGDPVKETAALDTVIKDSANFVLLEIKLPANTIFR
ncbi:MAG: PAS domain S-box protein [Proteobacteria bacterium]|nr:PAS domain S-box protein [Pseudomonadota bacterium]